MNTPGLSNQRLASDPGSLNALKFSAGQEGDKGKAALKETAKQFEALFMRELIKSMREATMKSGLLEGEGGNLGNDLLDQQFAVQLSGMPGGLSGAIERQLSRQMAPAEPAAADATKTAPMASTVSRASGGTRQAGFVDQHSQAAAQVARESGIPASYMIGQAGHETGWGRSEIRHRDGSPSFNLFGIKAGGNWNGPTAEITTTEYIGGVARKVTAKFRAYDSYEDAFKDHARLLTQSPRYSQTVAKADTAQGYAQGLQKAGYATDPAYANKLTQVINTALRVQRSMA